MCYVTVSEFRANLLKYLDLSDTEPVNVTRNKKVIAIIQSPRAKAYEEFLNLEGCLKNYDDGTSYEDLKLESIVNR